MLDCKFKIDLSALEELSRRYPEASREAREEKITEALLLLEAAVVKNTPYGAGPIHLRETIHHKVRTSGEKVVGITGTPVEHAEPVEKGTRPHFPPVAPIQFWVEKKLGVSGEEARAVAFLIARAISKRGTKGARMFGKAFDDNENRVRRILAEIPPAIARRVNR